MTRIMVDALAARCGGTAYAAIETGRRLGGATVVAGAGSIVARGLAGCDEVDLVTVPRAVAVPVPTRVAWEATRLPALVAERTPQALLTWSGMLPVDPGVPVLSFLNNPHLFSDRHPLGRLRALAARRTARYAHAVLVASEGARAPVEAAVGRSAEVVPHGVDIARFSPGPEPGREILCVADFYPHKRVDLLLAAWARLRPPRPRLRLIGDPRVHRRHWIRLRDHIQAHRALGPIAVEHDVPHERMPEAYRAARVVVIPSEAETFCMPVAEAHACGVPVVVRDMPSVKDAGGSAATYVAGYDPGVWAAAMRRLLEDDAAHAAAASAGVATARAFTWDAATAALWRALGTTA